MRRARAAGRDASRRTLPMEEVPVWLEVNGRPMVTWMCTPACWRNSPWEGSTARGSSASVERRPSQSLRHRPWLLAEIPAERAAAVAAEGRRPVLASGAARVATFLADPRDRHPRPARGAPAGRTLARSPKELFARGERYQDTGGIHAAALHRRHCAPLARRGHRSAQCGGQGGGHGPAAAPAGWQGLASSSPDAISAELAFKGARAALDWIATPSVPSTLAVEIARRSGMRLIGRAASAPSRCARSGGMSVSPDIATLVRTRQRIAVVG